MARGLLMMSVHGLVVAGVVAFALWATGASAGAAMRVYDTATPHSPPLPPLPPYANYKYIPLHSTVVGESASSSAADEQESGSGPSAAELILTALRTALDVVRNINKHRAVAPRNATALHLRQTKKVNDTAVEGRGFEDYYDEHHHDETTTTAKPMKQGRYTDPWAGYYDWIINEGSFKFWSVFQLFTAALLLYACFSAIYYAKFNPIIPDYSLEYDDYFLERTVGRKARSLDVSELPSGLSWINPTMFQFILNAISKHYEEE